MTKVVGSEEGGREHRHRCFLCETPFVCTRIHYSASIAVCPSCSEDPRIAAAETQPNEKLCPLCGERPRAVTVSGHMRPYCRECTREVNATTDANPGEAAVLKRLMKMIELLSDHAARARVARFLADRYVSKGE